MNKLSSRKRRGAKTKFIIKKSGLPRLVIFRSISHIYAQITISTKCGDKVLVSASTIDKEIKVAVSGNKVAQAVQVGKLLGKRAQEKSISKVAFDRSGFMYHGRVKALAEGARESGLNF